MPCRPRRPAGPPVIVRIVIGVAPVVADIDDGPIGVAPVLVAQRVGWIVVREPSLGAAVRVHGGAVEDVVGARWMGDDPGFQQVSQIGGAVAAVPRPPDVVAEQIVARHEQTVPVVGVQDQTQARVLFVLPAHGPAALLPGRADRRQKDPPQKGKNGDHDQQFDQREAVAPTHRTDPHKNRSDQRLFYGLSPPHVNHGEKP